MHILLVHQAFVSPKDAGGTRHIELAKPFVGEGHQFTIVASRYNYLSGQETEGASNDELHDGVRVIRANCVGGQHRSYVWRVVAFVSFMISAVWKGVRVKNVDVVMGTSPSLFQAVSAWMIAAIRRRPFVLEIRDLWPEFAIDIGLLTNPVLIWMARRVEMFLYRRATHMLVNSPAYRDYLISKGVPAENISFIANGVDPQMFSIHRGDDTIRAEFGLQDKFVVTYAGAIGMANDLDTLLDAAEQLRQESEIHFLIVGDGKERSRLQSKAESAGLTNVTFTGARPKSDMPNLLAESDACLAILKNIPMFKTTYPNKVFDYMAAKRPIVLAIDGVIRDVVEEAGGGICVSPGDSRALADAVLQMYQQPQQRIEMGLAGQRYVAEHFDRRKHALQFQQMALEVGARRAA